MIYAVYLFSFRKLFSADSTVVCCSRSDSDLRILTKSSLPIRIKQSIKNSTRSSFPLQNFITPFFPNALKRSRAVSIFFLSLLGIKSFVKYDKTLRSSLSILSWISIKTQRLDLDSMINLTSNCL